MCTHPLGWDGKTQGSMFGATMLLCVLLPPSTLRCPSMLTALRFPLALGNWGHPSLHHFWTHKTRIGTAGGDPPPLAESHCSPRLSAAQE